MLKHFTLFLFKLYGWRVEGSIPDHVKKCVVVGAPHTSNFDFIFAMAGLFHLKPQVNYLIKKEWLDNFFLKKIFKNAGAIGVRRDKNTTMVEALADYIANSNQEIYLLISPEGTRKLAKRWKTGFYYIALKAKIPLVLSSLDYEKKIAAIGPTFMPTGCYRKDMLILRKYYSTIKAKFPENFSCLIYEPDSNAICAG